MRDPYTRLGGVASGISHHYGIDVSLVRIAFVVFTLASGFGLVTYLLAWLIIPRAKFWPPVAMAKPIRALSGREIGVGLLLLGALVAVWFNGGAVSQVLVPLILIGGGVWLLTQPDTEKALQNSGHQPGHNPAYRAAPASGHGAAGQQFNTQAQPVDTILAGPGTMPRGTPVAPASRRRRRVLFGGLAFLVALPVLGIIAGIIALASADFDFDVTEVNLQPQSVEAVPQSVSQERGDILIDLTDLEPSMFSDASVPIDVDVDVGKIEVIVPDDLTVDVEADVGVGDLTVFDSNENGLGSEINVDQEDPNIELDVSLGVGEVIVRRG